MKKVLLIHGYQGSPNGGWRPWLMAELDKEDIYACALPMPNPFKPRVSEWIDEIGRNVAKGEDVLLVGHSLGVPAILHYLQDDRAQKIRGAVSVSGPAKSLGVTTFEEFIENEFDFAAIKRHCSEFFIIHGDDDPLVPLEHAQYLSSNLDAELIIIPNGGHLNGQSGFYQLPECLAAVKSIFR